MTQFKLKLILTIYSEFLEWLETFTVSNHCQNVLYEIINELSESDLNHIVSSDLRWIFNTAVCFECYELTDFIYKYLKEKNIILEGL